MQSALHLSTMQRFENVGNNDQRRGRRKPNFFYRIFQNKTATEDDSFIFVAKETKFWKITSVCVCIFHWKCKGNKANGARWNSCFVTDLVEYFYINFAFIVPLYCSSWSQKKKSSRWVIRSHLFLLATCLSCTCRKRNFISRKFRIDCALSAHAACTLQTACANLIWFLFLQHDLIHIV